MYKRELGERGEKIACEELVKKGYKILERNYRIKFGKKEFGEIDIIAKKKWGLFGEKDKAIHFIEVKTIVGNAENFYPEEKVDWKKQRKLKKLCLIWLEKNNYPQEHPYQIDIMGILINQKTRRTKINYFSNAVEDI